MVLGVCSIYANACIMDEGALVKSSSQQGRGSISGGALYIMFENHVRS